MSDFDDWDGGDDADDDGPALYSTLAAVPTWVIPPASWGSAYVDFYATRQALATPTPKIVIHHSGGSPPAQSPDAEHQWLRNVEAYGESRDGAKVEYNWVVMPSGRVYMGFGDGRGCHCSAKNPATGQTFNYSSHGICLPGDFYTAGRDTPTQAALGALVDLLVFLIGSGRAHEVCVNLDPARNGVPTADPGTYGHWGLAATGCPGARLFDQLPAILDDVDAELDGTAAPAPPAWPKPGNTLSSDDIEWIQNAMWDTLVLWQAAHP